MNVSYQWLKSLVPVEWGPEELADRLTFAGLSVEGIEYFNKGIKNVVVAEIKSVENHPDPKHTKWHVCKVDAGKGEDLTIVCGAPNVKVGIKAPLALIGATLPGGFQIEAADKAGVTSAGMLCSVSELQIPEGLATHESEGGIFILPADLTVGEDIVSALHLDDAILEFELTPNRADCLSVNNIAREVAAISGKPLHLPEIQLPTAVKQIKTMAEVEVLDKDLCPRYTAKLVEDIKAGSSPLWLRHRLAAAGIRSISNIVDISNYVMLEMNQPSHTFDYDLLADHKIIVRRAEEGETIVTLDDQERLLTNEMLLICDGERPVGIAGVMGGQNTEITPETKNILIECAAFYPKSIRLTSRKLGLASEAASRFEKGVDIAGAEMASNRICQLLCELAGGVLVEGTLDSHTGDFPEKKVDMIFEHARKTIGVGIDDDAMIGMMDALAFSHEDITGGLRVSVPHYRLDIEREVDLIEEVARLNGYDKIPATLPVGQMTEGKKNKGQRVTDQVRSIMVAMGFSEVISYSFMNQKHYDLLQLPIDDYRRQSVKIMNPFSDEQGVVRTTVLPGVLAAAARNMNRRNLNLSLFELASAYLPVDGEKLPREKPLLTAVVSGAFSKGWNGEKVVKDFYYLKGVVENLFSLLKIEGLRVSAEHLEPFLHPGRSCNLLLDGEVVGYLGELHPLVAQNYDLPQKAVVFELALEALITLAEKELVYEAVSKFPAVEIDLAFVADEDLAAADIEEAIVAAGGEYLKTVELFDIYQGNRIESGKKSLAYNLIFRAKEKTLKAEEISAFVENIKETLHQQYNIALRS
ncbi:MAG TPA: phenylalanine--tRNA ligase subunit beta [Clostridiales bacterium]|nr:phenylalanine--tRNA ligase subunit beta [Clostridiales bacterium]